MKRALYISGACLAVLLILFTITDPTKVPSFVLVLPFLLIFVLLLVLVSFILEKQGLPRARRLRISALIAGIPLLLLILQSIGQLTARDLLTMGALFALSYFYISRTTGSS